ncbi:MAG: hypothetical protein MJY56_02715, partial [Bacteroidales bacterium]|nr:hypothetical protein [Bacteroidales bacterium]
MKRILYTVISVLALAAVSACSSKKGATAEESFLEPLQKRDSVLIGDQFRFGYRLKGVVEGTRIIPDEFGEEICEDLEVLRPWKTDTLKVFEPKDGPRSYDLESYIVVSSFEEGSYEIPKLTVRKWSPKGVVDSVVFDEKYLEVKTIPVDTATFELHDLKDQIIYPVTAGEVFSVLGIVFGALALIAAAVFLIIRMRRKKAGVENVHKDPAHIVALRKLDSYRGEKFWAEDKQKLFYSGVTDALREYIDSRYGVSAMEMTTAEIFDGMKGMDVPVELYEDMKALFERADFVKFAKMTVGREEIANELPSAVRFVTMTYQSELQEEN